MTKTYTLKIGQDLLLTKDWEFTVTVSSVFTEANLELIVEPMPNHQYQSAVNTQGFDFPVLLPTNRNDVTASSPFTLFDTMDFIIKYKFKQNVAAVDQEVCSADTACTHCIMCSHSPADFVTG